MTYSIKTIAVCVHPSLSSFPNKFNRPFVIVPQQICRRNSVPSPIWTERILYRVSYNKGLRIDTSRADPNRREPCTSSFRGDRQSVFAYRFKGPYTNGGCKTPGDFHSVFVNIQGNGISDEYDPKEKRDNAVWGDYFHKNFGQKSVFEEWFAPWKLFGWHGIVWLRWSSLIRIRTEMSMGSFVTEKSTL